MDDNETTDQPATPEPKRRWFEPTTAILMAVASLGSAWCSYQSSRWSGQSGNLGTLADELERRAIAMHLESQQVQTAQIRIFTELVDARLEGKDKITKFYEARIGGEFKPAYEKWLALKPFDDPAAPPHPFVPGIYAPRFEQDIRDAHAGSLKNFALSNVAGSNASGYLGNTVTFATVLFFAGTAGKFDQRHVRQYSLVFAIVMFLYAVVRIAMLPVV